MSKLNKFNAKFITIAFTFCIITIIGKGQESLQDLNRFEKSKNKYEKQIAQNIHWSHNTHGKSRPNYEVVFPKNSVNKIIISMSSSQWDNVCLNILQVLGIEFGNYSMHGKPTKENPEYIDVTLEFNGKKWKNIGFRLKGNSSLMHSWSQGNYKLPFRLNFDKFEDIHPTIKNQRFYGFKELSFSPGFKDQSLIREKLTTDIFRLSGIVCSKTAFYQVYIDFGKGLKYCGIYTALELPNDNMLKEQVKEENGNIYKPESTFSSFDINHFSKKNNKKLNDYSDIIAFIDALNSPLRTSNEKAWRKQLETTFNIKYFIKYLAINNAIVNWDSYGNTAHNYFLYNHSKKKLTWIPWDHNEALNGNPGIKGEKRNRLHFKPEMQFKERNKKLLSTDSIYHIDTLRKKRSFGFPPPLHMLKGKAPVPGLGHGGISLSMNEVTNEWPLINHIAENKTYYNLYKKYLNSFINNIELQNKIISLIDEYHNLIKPLVIGEAGEKKAYSHLQNDSAFIKSNQELKKHFKERTKLVLDFLDRKE